MIATTPPTTDNSNAIANQIARLALADLVVHKGSIAVFSHGAQALEILVDLGTVQDRLAAPRDETTKESNHEL